MRGGDEAKKVLGEPSVAAQDSADSKKMTHKDDDKNVTEGFGTMAGGRRSQRRRSRRMSRRVARRTHRRRSQRRRSQRRRGGMGNVRRTLAKAIVPFGLWGAQRLMRRKKNRKTMKRMV